MWLLGAACVFALVVSAPAPADITQASVEIPTQSATTELGGYVWVITNQPSGEGVRRPKVTIHASTSITGIEVDEKINSYAYYHWGQGRMGAISNFGSTSNFTRTEVPYDGLTDVYTPPGFDDGEWPPFFVSGDHYITKVYFTSIWLLGWLDGDDADAQTEWKRDVTKPTGSVSIDEGDSTTHTDVALTLSATDPTGGDPSASGVSEVGISNTDDSFQWFGWTGTGGVMAKTWYLETGGSGDRTVYVQYKDRVGHISNTYSDTIYFNRPPNGFQLYNALRQPVVSLTVDDDCEQDEVIGSIEVLDPDKVYLNGDSFTWSSVNVPAFGTRFDLGNTISTTPDGTSEIEIIVNNPVMIDYHQAQPYGGSFGLNVTATDSGGQSITTPTPVQIWVHDKTPPVCIRNRPSTYGPTNASSVAFDVRFDEDIQGLEDGNDAVVQLTGNVSYTGLVIQTITAQRYTVTVQGLHGTGGDNLGTLKLKIRWSFPSSITDVSGNRMEDDLDSDVVQLDYTQHLVSVNPPSPSFTRNGPIDFLVQYQGAYVNPPTYKIDLTVADVILHTTGSVVVNQIQLPDASPTNITPTVRLVGITGDGSVGISIAAGTSVDLSNNPDAGAAESAHCFVDNTAPTIGINPDPENPSPSLADTNAGPVTYTILYSGADMVTLSPDDVNLIATGTATGTVTVDILSTEDAIVTISNIAGNGTLAISIDAGTAADNFGNTAPAMPETAAFNVDNSLPTVTLSAPVYVEPFATYGKVNQTTTATFNVTYSGADSWVDLRKEDVQLSLAGTINDAALDVAVTDGTTSTPQVVLSNMQGDGTITVTLAPGRSQDIAGNNDTGPGLSYDVTVDNTPPSLAIGAPSALRANVNSVISFPVVYAHTPSPTVELVPPAVIIDTTGTVDQSEIYVNVVNGSSLTPTIELGVNTPTLQAGLIGDGQLRISVAPATSHDEINNMALGTDPSVWVTIDNTGPGISLATPYPHGQPGEPAVTTRDYGPVIDVPVFYSADAAGMVNLNTPNIHVEKHAGIGNLGSAWWQVVDGTSLAPLVQLSQCDGDGTIFIWVEPGTSTDDLGNLDLGSTASELITVINTAPSVSIRLPQGTPTNQYGTVTYQLDYRNATHVELTTDYIQLYRLSGDLDMGAIDVQITSGANPLTTQFVNLTNFVGDGTFRLSVDAFSSWNDGGFYDSGAESYFPVTVDNTPPTMTIAAPSTPTTINGPVSFDVTFFGASFVTVTPSDVLVLDSEDNPLNETQYTLEVLGTGLYARTIVISNINGEGIGSVRPRILAGVALDAVGNASIETTAGQPCLIDNDGPIVQSITPATLGPTGDNTVEFTVVFNENVLNFSRHHVVVNYSGTASDGAFVSQVVSASTYVVAVAGVTGDGTLSISVITAAAGPGSLYITDFAGNNITAGLTSPNVQIDNTPPSIALVDPEENETVEGPLVYTVNYTDVAEVLLDASFVDVQTSGSVAYQLQISGEKDNLARTVTVEEITGTGTLRLQILSGSAKDGAGNPTPASGYGKVIDIVLPTPISWWPLAAVLAIAAFVALRSVRRAAGDR